MKRLSLSKKTLSVITAGVLTLSSVQAMAVPRLSLTQRSSEIVTTPKDGNPGILDMQNANSGDSVEFTVSYIRNDMPMDVYLAFSTRPGGTRDWPISLSGQLELDPRSLEILAVVRVEPAKSLDHLSPENTSLGKAEFKTQSVVFSVELSDLSSPKLQGNEIFFQALAVPEKTVDFDRSQASDLDRYEIVR